MAAAGSPPFRAEHVGSLLRPHELREAHRAHAAGLLDDGGFRAAQERAIRRAVRMQEEVGLPVVTDGELRRASYWMHWVDAIEGLEVGDARFAFRDASGAEKPFTAPRATGRLRRTRPISGEEYELTASLTDRTVKVTMPAPSTFSFWVGEAALPAAYASSDDLLDDLAAIYREEIADLAARGCRYVQLDEVALVQLADPATRERVEREGEDPERLVAQYVRALNDALAGRPAGVVAAVHACRGNYGGRWLAEGGYDAIAEQVVGGVAADGFCLEYDTPRAGDFAPLRHVPGNARVVLGLVSSKTPELEEAKRLRDRIEEASRVVPLDRLGLSPQCGFASAAGGNPLDEAAQAAKLRLVVDVARAVWGDVA